MRDSWSVNSLVTSAAESTAKPLSAEAANGKSRMLEPAGGINASPCPCFDVDRSGTIDMLDFAVLQAVFDNP